MGKKRLKTIKPVTDKRPKKKSGKGQGRLTDMATLALQEAELIKAKEAKEETELQKTAADQTKTAVKPRKKKLRSRRYRLIRSQIDKTKTYSLDKAVSLLCKLANARIDETVEVHFSTLNDKLTGTVKLPHGSGKTKKVVIADEKVIDAVKSGKIQFDILIATPLLMPKIAPIARILGPKGLMPNPKNGTLTNNPEELKKKLEGGEFRFSTEPKTPLMHLIIGKISFGPEKILANLNAIIEAVQPKNIIRAYLTSTHSPSIRLEISSVT